MGETGMTSTDAARPALLVLEDGTTLRGTGFGADGETFGEMHFNTGMTGYQQTLTDPSYCRQIVAMTAPHIGNTGVNDTDPESRQAWVSGYVVREPARLASNWRGPPAPDVHPRGAGAGQAGVDLAGHPRPGCLPAGRGRHRDRRPGHPAADPAGARAGRHA